MGLRKRRRRGWLIGGTLIAIVLAGGAYERLTNPTRLRAAALEALRALPFDGIDVRRVTFSARGRLELTDLVIHPRRSELFYRCPAGAHTPPLLRVGLLEIDCRWGDLLLGRVRPSAVRLYRAGIALVCSPEGLEDKASTARADADARRLWELLGTIGNKLPNVTVGQADLQVLVADHGGEPQLLQRLLLRVKGETTPDGYDLRIDHRPAQDAPLAEFQWNRPAGEWTATLDWIDLKSFTRVLPAQVADRLAHLGLAGRARLARFVIRTPAPAAAADSAWALIGPAELRLADLHCTLPLEEQAAPPPDYFLQLGGGSATLTYRPSGTAEPGECDALVQGRLRGAVTTLHLRTQAASLGRLWAADDGHDLHLSLADILDADVRVDGLGLPTIETYPAFVRSPRLGGPIVAALRDYQPRGKVNLRLRVLPAGGAADDGATRIEGEIEALGAACRYAHFPYPFEDAQGTLRLTGGQIVLDHLTARHGAGRVSAAGVVHNSRSWSGFDLEFRGRGVALDDDLYAALPDEYRHLWQQTSPLGLCDVVTRVRRPDGTAETGPLAADVRVEANLLSGSLSLGDGRRLDHADGRLVVDNGVVHIENLHGFDGDTGVRLDGDARSVDGATVTDLRVEVTDLPIEHVATLALGSDAAAQIRFAGRADVWGRVRSAPPGGGPAGQFLAIHLKGGALAGLDPARPWSVQDGWVRVQDELREVLSLTCAQDGSRLDLAGTLPSAAGADQTWSLNFQARTTAVEGLYPQFVPPRWVTLLDELGLSGAAEVTVNLHPAGTEAAAARQAAEITLSAAHMQPRSLPLDLKNVTAELALTPGRFRLPRAAADWGTDGQILVRQGTEGTWQAGQADAEFEVDARKMALTPELIQALPGPAGRLLDKLRAQGEFDALLPSVHVSGGEFYTWRLEGRLPLRAVALELGLGLHVGAGALSGVCTVLPDGEIELDAAFEIAKGELEGRPIEGWAGRLQRDAATRWVRLENVHGRLCDGLAQGVVQIDPRTTEYDVALDLRDIAVDEMLPRPKAHPDRPRPGRIDGDVWARGMGRDIATRHGGGNLRVTGVSFLQTPVLASVFSLHLQPASDTVEHADVRFQWEGRQVRLERITIESQDLRLVGTGTWNMRDDTIRLTLWAARPEYWPGLTALDKMLELAGQELVQYRVEGTLADPKVTAKPLHSIDDALRRLLGE
jgi:hypothetical protein